MYNKKRILIVNPPLFVPKPHPSSLMTRDPYILASNLKNRGKEVRVFDFVDDWPGLCDAYGIVSRGFRNAQCGNFHNEGIMKQVWHLGRREEQYHDILKQYHPDLVYISNEFFYNWHAIKFVVNETKKINRKVKIVLGGVYATLCPEHAKENTGVDEVIVVKPGDKSRLTPIDIKLYGTLPREFPIQSQIGCPNSCSWCQVPLIEGSKIQQRDPIKILDDIEEKYKFGVREFIFWDPNLTYNYENHFKVILEGIIEREIKATFSTDGGISPECVIQEQLELMAKAGFLQVAIPLEFCQQKYLNKNRISTVKNWIKAIKRIKRIKEFAVSTFIFCGFPGQTIEEIYETRNFVKDHGVGGCLCFFIPIPGTKFQDPFNRPLEDLHPFLYPYASNKMKVEDLENMYSTSLRSMEQYVPEYKRCKVITTGPSVPIKRRD